MSDDAELDIDDLEKRMTGAVDALHRELVGLRTGRASVNLLEPITVEAYGAEMPLNQVATVSVPEARMLTVQIWDKSMVKAVEKAIRTSSLGLNPIGEGQLLRIPLPELTQERRNELVKVAHKYSEQAKVAVRNIRRDGMDQLKKMEKDGDMSEDDHRIWSDEVQTLTDGHVEKMNKLLQSKEEDILKV